MQRYQGFTDPDGLLVLDTFTGEVVLCARTGERRLLNPPQVTEPAASQNVGRPELVEPARSTAFAPPVPHGAPAAAGRPEPAPLVDLPTDIDDLDREVVLTFPYPVARPYLDLLNERDPRLRCKLLVDAFTAVLKVWALQVASEYLRAPEVRDALVHKTLVRDLARPLISAWNLLIQRTLPVLSEAGVPPFAPELPRCYEALETRCKQPFLVTESYEDDTGRTRTRTKRLGKIQALIAYRNGLAHGFNQSAKQAQRDLDTYLPLLREVLREARFLARYPLWHVTAGRTGSDDVRGLRLMGARPSTSPEPVGTIGLDPQLSPLFLRNEATGDVLPLFSFFDVNDVEDGGLPGIGRDVFLFEGSTRTTVIYVSATGEHAERASRFQHWQTLLAAKAVDVELLSRDTLTLDALRGATRRVADQAIEALTQSGKYLKEASVDRADLTEHLASFVCGRYGAFVLGGESGIGKSTLLARFVEQRRANGDAMAFYRASTLPGADVSARLLRDLGLAGMYLEDFLAAAAPLFGQGNLFWLVIDAVNELAGDVAALVRHLDQIVRQAAGHDWFRLLVSVRDGAYQRLPADARFGARGMERYYTVEMDRGGQKVRTPLVALAPVSGTHVETLYEAYRAYRQLDPDDPEAPGVHRFRPLTSFAELPVDGSTRALLRSPLMTRLVLEAFHRRALPGDLRSDQAMRLYLEHAVVESSHPGGGFPARRRVLSHLVREYDRAGAEVLARDALLQSGLKELRDALLNPQRDSPYVQLLELGVLLEEWDGDTCQVRFAFDRLFEHLLAELHDPRVQGPDDAIALAARALSFKSLRGALEVVLGRACAQGREALLIEVMDRSSVHPDESVRMLLRGVAATLVERFARERDPSFERLLAELPKQPSASDVDILLDVADRLALLGESGALDALLHVVCAEAAALGDPARSGKARLRLAQRLDVRGDWDRATEAFASAEDAARTAGDVATSAAAKFLAADLHGRRGDAARARGEMREALEQFVAIGERSRAAECLRRLGVLERQAGQHAEAQRLYRESRAIAEEIGDRRGLGMILNNLGLLAKDRGELADAERLYRESLAIKEEIGERRGAAMTLNNLATLARSRGDAPEAERLFLASLATLRDIGDRRAVSQSLTNLGILAWDQGDLAGASDRIAESLDIARALGAKPQVLEACYRLGALRMLSEDASAHDALNEVKRLAEDVRTPRARSLAAQAAVLLAVTPDSTVRRGAHSTEAMRATLESMRSARAGLDVAPDVEDGPSVVYLLVARAHARDADAAGAAALAREALREVGDRRWPHRAEAERLAKDGDGDSDSQTAG